jgi:hypothetical protein
MRYRSIWLLFVCVTLALTSLAASKRPWEWTDDERIAERFDSRAIEQRAVAYKAFRPKTTVEATTSRRGIRYVIDGQRNPELFLRHELFEDLLRGIDSDQPARVHQALEGDVRAAGFRPAAFWKEVESASRRYRSLQAQANASGHVRSRLDDDQLCAERAAALNQARQRLGATRFDAFPYTAIAPHVVHSKSTTFPDAANRLRREAEGCKKVPASNR